MRILILSKEAWRDEQNGGNVLSNLFEGFDAQFAQIYCNELEPNNRLCANYYQITDKAMVHSILAKGRAGHILTYDNPPVKTAISRESFSGGKRWLGGLLPVLRELAWWWGSWNKAAIGEFVKNFKPDIVFAPCYGNHYMHKLTRLVHAQTDAPIISYISDDHYTNRQLHWAPWYWINHFFLRRHTRDVFKLYSLVYTMTDEQKQQCERDFGANMKVLCKAGRFDVQHEKKAVNKPVKIVYAGGIYLNRSKTLKRLVDAIREIDPTGRTFRLDIYTNGDVPAKMQKVLNDGIVSQIHSAVSSSELMEIYHRSDIALHCESFDPVNRLKVRLSFSTKIVDCLDSGCAVMAICDARQAGLAYLSRNDAALCATKPGQIVEVLDTIKANPSLLIEYQHKAFALGRKAHLKENIQKGIKEDFASFLKK